ncbi:conjugal transfer protein TraD [Leptolyngbya sp. 15MV]|nr:conjugal transfer protein TraD [Leptolyngbya sp. 15MV]
MRRPRDYDAELKALDDKARALKDRKVRQLGELVIATGADTLELEVLAGALLATSDKVAAATKEEWRKRGAGFFRRPARKAADGVGRGAGGDTAKRGSALPTAGKAGAT